jgi:predicted Rossmann fold nucleotide-binding protein DprA/Smf involved in DNA uptake
VLTAAQATALSPSAPSSAFPATRSRTTPGVSDSTSSPDAEGNDLPLTDGRAEHQAVTDRSSPYSPECAAVLGALGPEPAHVDDVARAAQVAPAEALAALLQLELTGRVRQAAGLRFSRPERAASIG